METFVIKFEATDREFGVFELEAQMQETMSLENEVATHRIENGRSSSDHIHNVSKTLTIVADITDTPLNDDLYRIKREAGRREAYTNLAVSFYEKRALMIVYTKNYVWVNMAIVSMEKNTTPDRGERDIYTITFKQLDITDTKTVSLPKPVARKKTNRSKNVTNKCGTQTDSGQKQTNSTSSIESFINTKELPSGLRTSIGLPVLQLTLPQL